MKKWIKVLAVVCLLAIVCSLFAACAATKYGECEGCGKEANLKKVTVAGQTGWLCSDCEAIANALGGLLG